LIEQGVLHEQQVFEVIEAQRQLQLPFGVLAERMFDVTLDSIERAWAEQYQRFTGTLDLDTCTLDEAALDVVGRRPAWQFELLPLRFEATGELVLAATQRRLPRAVCYVAQRVPHPAFFRIASARQMRQYLQTHYPMPEVSADVMRKARAMRLAS
jgi:hypothetical protein